MSEEQAFVLTMSSCKVLTRNWTMHGNSGDLKLAGDFVLLAANYKTSTWLTSLTANNGFHVMPADEAEIAILVKAEDARRVEALAGHLIGLTEALIDKHLPEEFKRILERTPEVIGTLGNLMNDGVKKALDKMGKGK